MGISKRLAIKIRGIVQGVGFRPFIYGLATRYNLTGWVYNSSAGVFIEVQGSTQDCDLFLQAISNETPVLARIDDIETEQIELIKEHEFIIKESQAGDNQTLISPDMGICTDCLQDIKDLDNRRYNYAFTNCTNCGPRFSIIKDIPYDRALTTMADFKLCDTCKSEFDNPLDRRFHAQPNACSDCGPDLYYKDSQDNIVDQEPLSLAKDALGSGNILAVKGIGGYHLACDAKSEVAVHNLRSRKYRWDKPFALMMPNIETVREYCHCSEAEAALLQSQRRPIVLLEKKNRVGELALDIAPGNKNLGIMLPYAPLHYLLIEGFEALVMTSANYSDEPIIYQDELANKLLESPMPGEMPLADGLLGHNRQIFRRCDDSVMMITAGKPVFFRRSRGYAPEPIHIDDSGKNILAVGAEQKNAFCLTRGDMAFLSQHIGNLDNLPTFNSFVQEIGYFEKMFNSEPEVIAHDLHPQYLSTKYVQEETSDIEKIAVQHHHAHLVSVLAEHQLSGQAIGLMFDGTGYGEDGSLWGGEVLIGDTVSYRRAAHLLATPLPGGVKAIREPWRMALSCLDSTFELDDIQDIAPKGLLADDWEILVKAMRQGINSPQTSSMGRLFDAVAALMDIGRYVNYEGQAAVELEQVLDKTKLCAYDFNVDKTDELYVLDWRPMIRQLVADIENGVDNSLLSARFHRSIINLSINICVQLREDSGIDIVALSGGCWQNKFLLENCIEELNKLGFQVYFNNQIPINDGGIAYGQAAVAAAKIKGGNSYVFGYSR